jgi:hypothetical protein
VREITVIQQCKGAPGQPGRFPFPRRAHLLTTRKRAVVCLRHRALISALSAGLRPVALRNASLRLGVRGGFRFLRKATDNAASRHCLRQRQALACANLPPAALPQRWAGTLPPMFSFAKENQKTRKDGDAQSRSITWRQRSSAGALVAPLLQRRLI